VGSFLNVVIWRLPRGESLLHPGSHCPACDRPVRWYDNVPVLGWLWLRGCCRDCRAPISARYPLVEAATALLFAACGVAFGASVELAPALVFCAALVAVSGIDLDHRIIPDVIVLPLTALALAYWAVFDLSVLPWAVIGALGGAVFLLAIALAYPSGMGLGDVKLALMMGAFLGGAVVPALFAGFLAGAVVGVAMIARHGMSARKQAVPFGPFLSAGAVLALFAGSAISDWYLGLF
jgi:leader peptidase (prepilin peptidase)/N-methyltransferase